MLKLYNTISCSKEIFIPANNKHVKMYVCGITPYDTTHLGHAFTYVWFDVLNRYLSYKGYIVNYVQNVTDVDDSILNKAKEIGKNWKELGNFWTKRFLSDMKFLNVKDPERLVNATDYITSMIRILEVLIKKKFGYQKNGNVYFEVKKFKNYGKLSKLSRKEMIKISKERGANPDDPLKKDPLDFILWQVSKENEPFWDSPYSKGRPGWHIECSAMIKEYLGDQIDIHGGGSDLIFPHHESEIAQSETFTGKKPFAKYWIHTAMVRYKGKKMAKSLGNLVMVKDLAKKYNANEIRMLLLSHDYRESWEYFEKEFKKVKENLAIIKRALKTKHNKKGEIIKADEYAGAIEQVLDNDMDTSKAINKLLKAAEIIIKENKFSDISLLQKALKIYLKVLGFKI